MATAVQNAPKTVVTQKPDKQVDPKKQVASELKKQLNPSRNSNYLPKETAEKLSGWAKDRLARIAKTRTPNLVMFCIGKSENENTVVYMGQLKAGTAKLRDDGPAANAFWIDYARAADGSKEQNLTIFEKQMAYGYDIKPPQNGEAKLTIVSLQSKPMRVRIEKLAGESKPRIVARVKCCGVENCRLLAVYVTCKTGLIPGVEHIDIIALHPQTGTPLAERVTG